MVSLISAILYILSVYYLTIVITEEDGPFDLFIKMRARSGMGISYHDGEDWVDVDNPAVDELDYYGDYVWQCGDSFTSKVMSCHRCLSPYVGAALLPIALLIPTILLPLAAGGFVIVAKEGTNA